MKKMILVLAVMALMLASVVSAAGNLEFEKVEVKTSDGDKTVLQGGNAKKDIKPGSSVEIELTIANNATVADYEIQDIEVEVVIDSMEDGEDQLELDIDNDFDLRMGRDKKVSVDFEVPYYISDGQYEVTVTTLGSLENGTQESGLFTFTIEVEKENDEIVYKNVALTPEKVKCGAESILDVTIVNIGEDEQENVKLEVASTDLAWSETDTFDLDSGDDKEDIQLTKLYTIATTKDTKAGIYPITVKTTYDDDNIVGDAVTTLNLEVECGTAATTGTSGTTTGTTTVTGATTTTVTAGTNVAQPPAKTTSALESSTKLIYLGYVVVIAVFILVFMKLVSGKKGPKMDEEEF